MIRPSIGCATAENNGGVAEQAAVGKSVFELVHPATSSEQHLATSMAWEISLPI